MAVLEDCTEHDWLHQECGELLPHSTQEAQAEERAIMREAKARIAIWQKEGQESTSTTSTGNDDCDLHIIIFQV